MTIQEGYRRYACDVASCNEETYAMPNTDAADMYVTRRRIDASGQERELVLCSEHAQVYSALVESCDTAFDAFERSGEETLTTAAEVEALEQQLAEVTQQLEETTKSRDHWWAEWKKLNDAQNAQ